MSTSKLAYHAGEFGKQPSSLASFPGPAQLSVTSSTEKRERVRVREAGRAWEQGDSSQDTKMFRGYIWILLGIRVFCYKVMQNVGKVKMRCSISNVCSMHGTEK